VANRITSWCIDCEDPEGLAAYWAAVLDWVITDRDDELVTIRPSADAGWGIDFIRVPDGPKQVKNRIHLDLTVDAVQPLLDAGATLLREDDFAVLADPEGNELCAFTRPPGS
jgi:hypothetical protein